MLNGDKRVLRCSVHRRHDHQISLCSSGSVPRQGSGSSGDYPVAVEKLLKIEDHLLISLHLPVSMGYDPTTDIIIGTSIKRQTRTKGYPKSQNTFCFIKIMPESGILDKLKGS